MEDCLVHRRPEEPLHPVAVIRERGSPSGMSVTETVKTLGVALSDPLNLSSGKSPLSPEMATRLEKAFGTDSEELLAHQVAFDCHA